MCSLTFPTPCLHPKCLPFLVPFWRLDMVCAVSSYVMYWSFGYATSDCSVATETGGRKSKVELIERLEKGGQTEEGWAWGMGGREVLRVWWNAKDVCEMFNEHEKVWESHPALAPECVLFRNNRLQAGMRTLRL